MEGDIPAGFKTHPESIAAASKFTGRPYKECAGDSTCYTLLDARSTHSKCRRCRASASTKKAKP